MKAVFLDRATIDQSIDLSLLEAQLSELKTYPLTKSEQIIERVFDFDVLITNKVQLYEEVLSQLPNLKLICITATGTNNVDLIAADKLNIKVSNVAGYSTASVSQHVFAYLLNHASQVNSYIKLNQDKPWFTSDLFCQFEQPINELAGLNLGIVGYGELGQAVAKIARAFGMKVLISERAEAKTIRVGRVSFNQMLTESDIVSLHCPLTQETNSLFNQNVFNRMKKGCVLINTARGPIVSSADLVVALKNGQLGHAIIDVLESEPPEATHPLLKSDLTNLTLTHHIAWGSLQAQQRLMNSVAENVRSFAESF